MEEVRIKMNEVDGCHMLYDMNCPVSVAPTRSSE